MDFSQLSDEALIVRFRQHEPDDDNPKLLSELVRRHQDQVVRKCRYYVKDIEVARDLSQEVWIRVLTKLTQFDTNAAFTPWLFAIVHNRCYDHLRKDKRLLHQEISRKIVDTLEEELDTEHVSKPTVEILEELMDKITGEEKLMLLLKYQRGWSIKAIQQSLHMGESGVKMRLSRACEKMQKLLKKYKNDRNLN